jgi:hypothetical protein
MGVMNRFLELDSTGAVLQKPQSVIARLEPARGLMWGPTLPEQLAWEAGKKACAEFRLFGYTNWRMPTVEELFLLPDRTRFNPAIDTDAFPDTKPEAYWTSTPAPSSPESYAIYVVFSYGNSDRNNQNARLWVRPVRSVGDSL